MIQYIIVRPDGTPVTVFNSPSSTPLIFSTALAANHYRTNKNLDPEKFFVVPRQLVDPQVIETLRSSLHKMHRRAQLAEGRLARVSRQQPPAWRANLYFESLRVWRRTNKNAPPPAPELERYRLALALAVRAMLFWAGDRLATARVNPSSALYLKCADDEIDNPSSRYRRAADAPALRASSPPPCQSSFYSSQDSWSSDPSSYTSSALPSPEASPF